MIAIKPNDYGQEETVGEIVWVTAEALAVKRTDEQVGDVLVHYPRLGYLFEARLIVESSVLMVVHIQPL